MEKRMYILPNFEVCKRATYWIWFSLLLRYAVSAKKAKRQNLLDVNDLHKTRHLTAIGIKCSCLDCCGAIEVLSLLNHRITWLLSQFIRRQSTFGNYYCSLGSTFTTAVFLVAAITAVDHSRSRDRTNKNCEADTQIEDCSKNRSYSIIIIRGTAIGIIICSMMIVVVFTIGAFWTCSEAYTNRSEADGR